MNQDSGDQVRSIELAEWLGVSERAVADYAHRGIITRSGRAVFPLKESIRAVCHHFREAASARGATSGGLTAQRERIAKGQADKLEMQNAARQRVNLSRFVENDKVAAVTNRQGVAGVRQRRRKALGSVRLTEQLCHLCNPLLFGKAGTCLLMALVIWGSLLVAGLLFRLNVLARNQFVSEFLLKVTGRPLMGDIVPAIGNEDEPFLIGALEHDMGMGACAALPICFFVQDNGTRLVMQLELLRQNISRI